MIGPRSLVPCNGCRLCCINEAVVLQPQLGDEVTQYETRAITNPLTGKPALMLAHKPNGECIYLGDGGCTIHDRAPAMCRAYDCRRDYASRSRSERRRMIKAGAASQAQFDAGRDRIHTLEKSA